MLAKQRKRELGWVYLKYTKALEFPTASIDYKFIRNIGVKLIAENPETAVRFASKELLRFYKDLVRVLKRINKNSHSEDALSLLPEQRHKIAYAFAVYMTRQEFWWLAGYSRMQVRHFFFSYHMTQEEAEEFFKELVADASKLGHAQNKTLRGTHA